MKRLIVAMVLLGLAGPGTEAFAKPRIPAADAEVVERLPATVGDTQAAGLRPWRDALSKEPANLAVATRLARAYVEIGRTTGDPRYAGYAQAALAPWWDLGHPPAEVLVLRATLRQRIHEFDPALRDLETLLRDEPRNAQARLTRATILQVQGRLDDAARECAALTGLTARAYAVACAASVDSLRGGAARAYGQLETEAAATTDPGARGWLLGLMAEIAERTGRTREAQARYREALLLDPEDQYLLGAYADLLLAEGRPREVLTLLSERTRADGLMLRYTIAATALGTTDALSLRAQLQSRFDASRLRGDRVHLREEARHALLLRQDPGLAVTLALENWAVQKEPADALVLAQAAMSAKDTSARRVVEIWLAATGLEDVRLKRLLAAGSAAAPRAVPR